MHARGRLPTLIVASDAGRPPDVPVSRAKDFSFAWSRGGADAELIVQGGGDLGANYTHINCAFPSQKGNDALRFIVE